MLFDLQAIFFCVLSILVIVTPSNTASLKSKRLPDPRTLLQKLMLMTPDDLDAPNLLLGPYSAPDTLFPMLVCRAEEGLWVTPVADEEEETRFDAIIKWRMNAPATEASITVLGTDFFFTAILPRLLLELVYNPTKHTFTETMYKKHIKEAVLGTPSDRSESNTLEGCMNQARKSAEDIFSVYFHWPSEDGTDDNVKYNEVREKLRGDVLKIVPDKFDEDESFYEWGYTPEPNNPDSATYLESAYACRPPTEDYGAHIDVYQGHFKWGDLPQTAIDVPAPCEEEGSE